MDEPGRAALPIFATIIGAIAACGALWFSFQAPIFYAGL